MIVQGPDPRRAELRHQESVHHSWDSGSAEAAEQPGAVAVAVAEAPEEAVGEERHNGPEGED
jgi:hypothetical protein